MLKTLFSIRYPSTEQSRGYIRSNPGPKVSTVNV